MAPPPPRPYSPGFKTGILESPTISWPPGSIADIVLTSSLPIEAVDAPAGKWIEKGRAVVTYQVGHVAQAMTVTGDDVQADQFRLQSAELQADQTISLAEQNLTAAREELEEAKRGEGVYGVGQSRKDYEAAEAALAAAKSRAAARIAAARSRVDRDEAALNAGNVYAVVSQLDAPITGTVVWLNAKVGHSAGTPGSVIGEIANSQNVTVHANFPDSDRLIVVPRTAVQVEFSGKPNWMVPGEIVQTQQSLPARNGSGSNVATIKILDQGHLVRPTSKIVGLAIQTGPVPPPTGWTPVPSPTTGQT